jgi:predicted dehydrogenase
LTAIVKAGIVGLGRWGQMLVTANAANPHSPLRFTRATTRSPAKAADFCAAHGLPLDPDLAALLSHDELDAIVLATPHSQHAGQIRAAAAAGRHVFVEKPLALTLEDAESAVAACRSAGRALAVGFNRRFLPAFRALESMTQQGTLGQPLHVEGGFCGPFGFDYTDDMWRGSRAENPAGGMAAMGIHVLDAMIALMGPVRRVAVLSRRRAVQSQLDDTTAVLLDFASGATGTLSTLMATASGWRLRVAGDAGWAEMPDQDRLLHAPIGTPIREQTYAKVDTLALELAAFVTSITAVAPYVVTQAQALASVAAMTAISESAAADGAWVDVATPRASFLAG